MHWYTKDGESRYDAGIREARKEGYLPSITSIDNVIANPGLRRYFDNQMFDATRVSVLDFLTTEAEEKEAAFKLARRHSRKAAQVGTLIHYMIRYYIEDRLVHNPIQLAVEWAETLSWIHENGITPGKGSCEQILVGDGYAGKADYFGPMPIENVLIDWKTQSIPPTAMTKKGQPYKNRWYDSWLRQLAALYYAMEHKPKKVLSVMIGTNPDNLGVWMREWTSEELVKGFEEFKHALALWKSINNFGG